MTFILRRSVLVAAGGKCTPGLAQFDARALAQSGIDFGDVVGNGIDCHYADGFTDADWFRIAEESGEHAFWMLTKRAALGLPAPSREATSQIVAALKRARK